MTPDTPTPERRIAPRFQPTIGTVCRIKAKEAKVGLVWNLSETGVSMFMADPPKAGTQVVGELTIEEGGPIVPVTFKVIHVKPVQTGDYFIGCHFARPLRPDEMQPFLAPPKKTAAPAAEIVVPVTEPAKKV